MHSVTGGSGEDVLAGHLLWCRFVPIHLVVLDQVPWLGGIASLSGRGPSEEHAFWMMVVRCDSTIWRLWIVSREDSALSLRSALKMAITFFKIEAALASLRTPTEPSQFDYACTVLGTSNSIFWSLFLKKWAMAVTCLHSWTLGQSGQSQDHVPSLTKYIHAACVDCTLNWLSPSLQMDLAFISSVCTRSSLWRLLARFRPLNPSSWWTCWIA